MHDEQEFRDRYGPLAWRTVYRIFGDFQEALDCCQDVLLGMFQQQEQREMNDAYLRWLATRRAIDCLRKRKRTYKRIECDVKVVELPEKQPGPVQQAEFHELVDHLRVELTKLPDRQVEAFWMRCIDEMSYNDIAEQLEIDTGVVGVLIHRAKSRLRTILAHLTSQYVDD